MINKTQARLSFNKAAINYDEAAVLQREIGSRLIERLDYIRFKPGRILDVGAGTGTCTYQLADIYRGSEVIALDFARAMLQQARLKRNWKQKLSSRFRYLAADANHLPLTDNSVDMIFSNLALQWCTDLNQVFTEFRRVLKPGGMLMFSTFGPDTLKELKACWQKVDAFTHVNQFADLHDVGDALLKSGFSDPVMDMEMITVTYPDVKSIMRDLKQIGAHNVNHERARGLTGRQRLKQLVDAYEVYRVNEVLPVSHEVIYGHAWIPEHKDQLASHQGIQKVSLEEISRMLGNKEN